MQASYPPPQAPKSSSVPLWLIIGGVVLLVLVAIVGVLAVLGVYGTRKYIANAKTAEARNTLGMIGRSAVTAYEDEGITPDDDAKIAHRICPSASAPVPASKAMVSGKKYQSTPGEWTTDAKKNAGFSCLKFEMSQPQYFQYEYEATATSFVARAHGDLNGNGIYSTFELRGQVVGDKLVVAPSITEIDPEE